MTFGAKKKLCRTHRCPEGDAKGAIAPTGNLNCMLFNINIAITNIRLEIFFIMSRVGFYSAGALGRTYQFGANKC